MKDGYTPLHIAAQNGHSDIVEIFIKLGADISVVQKVNEFDSNDCDHIA